MVSFAQISIVNIFLEKFDPPRGSHLGVVHTILVIFNGVSSRNILINFIEISHTEHTILKCVTGQHLLFSKQIFFTYFFYCACIFQARIIDGTLCLSHIATILY